jgi:uncharacterized protein (DUF2147 family)
MKSTVCKSGIIGWKSRLQENYSSFSEFNSFDNIYGIAHRLGYKTAKGAWRADPIIEGSTNPEDLRKSKDS